MFEDMEPTQILLIGGGLIGLAFGFLGQSSRFCFRQAAGEAFEGRRAGQLRGWLIATLIAVGGTQALIPTFEIDLSESAYWGESLPVLSLILGGIMFGIGMMLARGCAGRQVVLAATGNLRSLIVILMIALSGYMTMRGLFAPVRQSLEGAVQVGLDRPDVVQGAASLFGFEVDPIRTGAIVLACLLAFILIARSIVLRDRLYLTVASVIIGTLVVGGWYVTGVIGFDEFEPQRLESLTFVAPGGNAMQFLMIYTGTSANFGIMLIGGVIAGSFVSALLRRELKLQGFSGEPKEMLRYLGGGLLMGTGAVMAIGCSIGQGLSGISTLAFSSIISLSAIVVGAKIGHWLMNREQAAATNLAAAE
ncbi:YeeE/YedE family protein [Terasakiella sp. A23]|uniref:YeeE/YedE family protein n=1 Tax=Terasakiella sp. FCG-A23 TaxID=3080561 RepID=UPI00295482FB|nr:YeeE/YedE family protein [Terasakiella sp. A23]MDV7338133.1 YeeE/YedE family protein [Terasakiella sp. A23]